MSAYRVDFDETKCMYFMIKEVKNFDKYMEIWEKVSNIIMIKKINSELIYTKKCVITKKHSIQKKASDVFYRKVTSVPVILID